MGRNLLVGGKSGINLVSPRYTFVKQGPGSGEFTYRREIDGQSRDEAMIAFKHVMGFLEEKLRSD